MLNKIREISITYHTDILRGHGEKRYITFLQLVEDKLISQNIVFTIKYISMVTDIKVMKALKSQNVSLDVCFI